MQTDIDVAVQGVGVRTNLMRGVQERLCLGLGQTCDVCMEINVKPKATAFELRKADFDCCRTGCWGQFHTLRDQQHGIVKTRTIPQRKKLLGFTPSFLLPGGTVLIAKLPSSSLLTPERPPVAVALVLYKTFTIIPLGFGRVKATKAWLFPRHSEMDSVYVTASPAGLPPTTFRTALGQVNPAVR